MELEFQINGLAVKFDLEDAIRWNDGDWEDDRPVEVLAPITHGAGSYVRDGMVVMIQGLPDSEWQEWDADDELLADYECVILVDGKREIRLIG